MNRVIWIIVPALVLRIGLAWLQSGQLTDDRDAYLAIAGNLASGRGYSSVETGTPTAYRPPLYPALLAPAVAVAGPRAAVAGLNILTGTLTVWITYSLGRRLGSGRGALLAAGIVAIDPLLLQYTAQPMTEVLSACLVTAFVWAAGGSRVEGRGSRADPAGRESALGAWQAVLVGVLFGAAALCRPTVWLAGGLLAAWWGWTRIRGAAEAQSAKHKAPLSGSWLSLLGCLAGVAVVVSPWAIRNWLVFGKPILTTTHGGYTLLLGNNAVFYREVVDQPWGTTWDGGSLERWNASLETALREAAPGGGEADEVFRDRWMYARARQHISEQPGTFLRACWLRFRRFWNVAPLEQSAGEIERAWRGLCQAIGWPGGAAASGVVTTAARWTVGAFYVAITAALLVGLFRMRREEWRMWMPLVLVIAAFCLVHLVYWTNTRMRAPVVPLIALLAARGVLRTAGAARERVPQARPRSADPHG